MHELSIIQHIISIAEEEVDRRGNCHRVESVDLEIGELAGVELESLLFLWDSAVAQTVLDKAACHIHPEPGTAVCADCNHIFQVKQFFDPCPQCQSHLISITGGEALRIKSLVLVDLNSN